MAAVAQSYQFFEGGHDAGTEGGEMDIADQFQQMPLFLAEHRLVAVLEEVAEPLMTKTESGRIAAAQCLEQHGVKRIFKTTRRPHQPE
jgi:hypothetical protein